MPQNNNNNRRNDRTQADTAEMSLRTSYDEARKLSAVSPALVPLNEHDSGGGDTRRPFLMTGKRKATSFKNSEGTAPPSSAGIQNNAKRISNSTLATTRKDREEESAVSSSSSSTRIESMEWAAAVTATTTASSGEDRDSTTGQSAGGANAANSSSSRDQSGPNVQPARAEQVAGVHHCDRHHREHHRQRSESHAQQASSDSMGLPLPSSCEFTPEAEKHAVVLAHLPPPSVNPSGCEGEGENVEESACSLVSACREPGFQTIRRTFDRFARRGTGRSRTRVQLKTVVGKSATTRTKRLSRSSDDSEESGADDSAVSIGSGLDEGYAGSASSNEPRSSSCSSQSVFSCEPRPQKRTSAESKQLSGDPKRPMLIKKIGSSHSLSSEIADFSSSESENVDGFTMNVLRDSPAGSPSNSSSSIGEDSASEQEDCHAGHKTTGAHVAAMSLRRRHRGQTALELQQPRPKILSLGCDVLAHVLTFLEPPEIVDVLTMPLSKGWLETFSRQPELWRVLCLLPPFLCQVDTVDDDSSDESTSSCLFNTEADPKRMFGKFRLMYTSFVRCMRYLARIKDDASNGRPPSVDMGPSYSAGGKIGSNQNLQQFLRRARGVVSRSQDVEAARLKHGSVNSNDKTGVAREVADDFPIGLADDGSSAMSKRNRSHSISKGYTKKKAKYSHSVLTQRLLGPATGGAVGNQELPWSCAIYSIVNWMAAFQDVEGIQTMCLKVLPFLLENEQQRMVAQRAGLTDIVLRAMVQFQNSSQLHTAAFHTIVLLARPLGGREGMLFHTSMVNSSGIFNALDGFRSRKNGIAIMLDSIQRFQSNEVLQAMSCWSLVNVALVPAQKEVLVRLGGIDVTANAMMEHPYSAEVQFRALFALINLVIPAAAINSTATASHAPLAPQEEDESEEEVLGAMVNKVVELVVLSMKNFCSSEAILNRACLVLHNLSLTPQYHRALLCTPNCYQMLEWCLGNYLTDQVLQQSAAGTLHRLQNTLSSNDSLRACFNSAQQAQQQSMLEQAHREAILLHEQYASNEENA